MVRPKPFFEIDRVNIAYVTSQNLRKPGGARTHVLGFCAGMRELGASIKIISPYDPLKTHNAKESHTFSIIDHFFRIQALRWQVMRCIRSGWPDAVYYRKTLIDPGLGFVVCRNKPLLFLEINGEPLSENMRFFRYRYSMMVKLIDHIKIRRSDFIVAVSSGLRDYILRTNPFLDAEKVILVNNAVNTQIFFPRDQNDCRRRLDIDRDSLIAVFAGKVAQWHGLHVAIDAMKILNAKRPGHMRLYVLGDGPALRALRRKAESNSLNEIIRFTGMVSSEDVALYIGASDVCLAPFIAERNDLIGISPLKLFEYIACCRPVICSNVMGIQEILSEVEGIHSVTLVKPDDTLALANALENTIRLTGNVNEVCWGIHDRISWRRRARIIFDLINKAA